MSVRGWLLALGVAALAALAIALVVGSRRTPPVAATAAEPPRSVEPPPAVESAPAGAGPSAPAPRGSPPPAAWPPGAPPHPPPRSEVPPRPPAPDPPPPEFRHQQIQRAQAMLAGEIQSLEAEQRAADAAGDRSLARELALRLTRLRARKDTVDQEVREAP